MNVSTNQDEKFGKVIDRVVWVFILPYDTLQSRYHIALDERSIRINFNGIEALQQITIQF